MNVLLVLPLAIPLTTTAVLLLVWRRPAWQRALSLLSAAALLASALALLVQIQEHGVCATQLGDWPAPFGITLVADLTSAILVSLAAGLGLAFVVYSLGEQDQPREAFGYFAMLQILLAGVCGAFLTGDLFNLFVWFEVILIASFVLLALGGEPEQLRGAIQYVAMNLWGSAMFLTAAGLLYGRTGTLNMAEMARRLDGAPASGATTAIGMLLLVAFGLKAAIFPLFFWLPASYHAPPPAVTALFAGLLTKVGVYAMLRVFTLIFVHDQDGIDRLLLALSAATMVTGVLGALAQREIRRLLSFHIISQIGYMTGGLAMAGLATSRATAVLALAGSLFYMANNMLVKTNLLLIGGVVRRLRGTTDLDRLGGLASAEPTLAALFLISALSLAGAPPLAGFFAKLALVRAAIDSRQYALVAAALGVGLLTLFSMTKIWIEAFWKPASGTAAGGEAAGDTAAGGEGEARTSWRRKATMAPIVVLAGATIVLGWAAEPMFALALRAAEQLVDREQYLRAVLGEP